MKSIVIAAAAVAAVAVSPASALPCVTPDTCDMNSVNGTATLAFDNPLSIEDENVTPSAYLAEGVFSIGGSFRSAFIGADVSFDAIPPGREVVPAGFADLVIEFFQEGAPIGTFVVTGPDGVLPLGAESYVLTLISGADVLFRITGVAFRNVGVALPDYNFNVEAVPLPTAGWLLFSGVAGLMFAGRTRARS